MLPLMKQPAVLAAFLLSVFLLSMGTTLLSAAGVGIPKKMPFGNKGSSFVGRWDITVNIPTAEYPDWLEVTGEGGELHARLQQRSGSVHPVLAVREEGGHLLLDISAATATAPAISWDLHRDGSRITGSLKRGDTVNGQIDGTRAPKLLKKEPKAWSEPEEIFNGKDLTGWEPDNASKVHWVVKDGAILNESGGANLKTLRKFQDFKLHVEFNCPELGNSGIYLRGRYEVQVEYEKPGVEDKFHEMGSIYGMLPPSTELPRKPGEWETFDITLVGRYVTIVRNGVTTIDHQEIPGITGGALDSHEGMPGPFYLQGDHTGGMKFRNITVSVPVEAGKTKKELKKAVGTGWGDPETKK